MEMHAYFGKWHGDHETSLKAARESSDDCTAVCGSKDCNKCIKQYWEATPTKCTPNCL
jgi:hypothetical protein